MGSQNRPKIVIFAVFWGMRLETLFLVNFCMIFVKNDGEKRMDFSLFFDMLSHYVFAKFAVFRKARNLKISDFP